MAEQQQLLMTREELMDVLDVEWARYIPTLEMLTDEEQAEYAERHDFDNLHDLIARIATRMWKTMDAVNARLRGEVVPDWKDEAEYEAHFAARTVDEVKADFENARTSLAGLIAELPVEAMEDTYLYSWLHSAIVGQYRRFQPPGDPQNPAEQNNVIM